MSSTIKSTNALQPDTLISIYAAAVTPVGWNDAIDRCAHEAQACGGALLSYDVLDTQSYSVSAMGEHVRETVQRDPTCLEEYFADIAPIEVQVHKRMRQYPAGSIWNDTEIWPDGMEKESRFHYDWLLRWFGVGSKLIVRLNDHPRIRDSFVLHFLEGQTITEHAVNAFRMQIPHLAKSSEMCALYNALHQRYAAVLAVLDKVDVGLCVLDGTGRVIVNNQEAMRMFDAGHGLSIDRQNHLQCKDSISHKKLVDAINSAQIHANKTSAENLLSVRRTPSSDPLLIEVSPLHDTLDELSYGLNGVLVQLIDTGSRSYCSVDSFAEAYKLTEAEKSITVLLLEGLTNREISEERDTSIETVKSQVATIMQKTNANSRVELVRSALKAQPPIQDQQKSI